MKQCVRLRVRREIFPTLLCVCGGERRRGARVMLFNAERSPSMSGLRWGILINALSDAANETDLSSTAATQAGERKSGFACILLH
jgi:hypothetical protein